MTHPFSAIVTASGAITFTDAEGASHTILRDNPRYADAKELLSSISKNDNVAFRDKQMAAVRDLVNIAKPIMAVEASSGGKITVRQGRVLYRDDRGETELHNVVAERIVWMLHEGFDVAPMMIFLERLMDNPSYRSVEDVYRFMEANKMGITPDGHILAYKKVRGDYSDIYTGTFNNRPGQKPSMRRNEVEDNPNVVCSNGLHVCSYDYLPQFGTQYPSAKVVVCKANPKDVVSVPTDYKDAKMRVCEYEVLYEVADYRESDPLSSAPVSDDSGRFNNRDESQCPMCSSSSFYDGNYCGACGYEPEDDEGDELVEEPNDAHVIPPVIEYLQPGGGWAVIGGHGCNTPEEAMNYVAALGEGVRIQPAQDDDFDDERMHALDLRKAVSGVNDAAQCMFGEGARVAVEMKLDGSGGLEVHMKHAEPPRERIGKDKIADQVKRIIVELLGVRERIVINSARLVDNLGADSLDGVELVMALEEEFNCEIADDEFDDNPNASVGEIVDFIHGKINQ